MSLADFQPSYFLNTFSRSSTFPKSVPFRAQERVRQISGHLSRSNTLASDKSDNETMARNTATPGAQGEILKETEIANVSKEDAPKPAFKKCMVCKAETVPIRAGNLDGEVEDKYNQLIPPPSDEFRVKNPKNPVFKHCKPPETPDYGHFSLFTAGSIEMGAAVQWQERLSDHLEHLPITITNPRRGHWNPNVNSKREDSAFFDQVKWELDALTAADVICYFFDCATISPVTLMELGLWAHSGKIIVCCDQRYWRQGNVEIVCERYNIPYVSSFEKFVPALQEFMKRKGLKVDKKNRFIGSGTGRDKVEKAPGVKEEDKVDRWWLEFQDSNEDRVKKGLEPLPEKVLEKK